MIAYLYQGPKSKVVKTYPEPISMAECEDFFTEAAAQGAKVVRTEKTIAAEVGDMIAFAVIGNSPGDYYRAAKAAYPDLKLFEASSRLRSIEDRVIDNPDHNSTPLGDTQEFSCEDRPQ